MLNQEVGWFDKKGTGELVNRLATDTYLVGNSLSQNLSDGLRSTVMVLAGTSMMVRQFIYFFFSKRIDYPLNFNLMKFPTKLLKTF